MRCCGWWTFRCLPPAPVTYGEGLADRVRAIAPDGVDVVLDASGRGEIPVSIELAGGPARVLPLVAFAAADSGVRIHTGGAAGNGSRALHEVVLPRLRSHERRQRPVSGNSSAE
ncbi:hypothetical protein ACFVXW_41140 [Streptomyces sp. NPDC058251]|uniref:hypothetical protein n=1 Tax=Streptomyces sp. NPDC058251 TaxID=3346404 RepID=UPI0036DFD0CE